MIDRVHLFVVSSMRGRLIFTVCGVVKLMFWHLMNRACGDDLCILELFAVSSLVNGLQMLREAVPLRECGLRAG
jgi:hypothetical protein